ncbi:hypothetical protein CsatA_022083 [Cannabis sativa]
MKRDYEKQQSNIKLIETKFARSLRKLGIKQPYLIQGGFQFWVKQGLRFKELKSESTLTILKEAEAILEDINPSLVQALGYGVSGKRRYNSLASLASFRLLDYQHLHRSQLFKTGFFRLLQSMNLNHLMQKVSLHNAGEREGRSLGSIEKALRYLCSKQV